MNASYLKDDNETLRPAPCGTEPARARSRPKQQVDRRPPRVPRRGHVHATAQEVPQHVRYRRLHQYTQ